VVWAAVCFAFFGQAQLGKLVIKSEGLYSIHKHPHCAAMVQVVTKFSNQVLQLCLPHTKVVVVGGKIIHWGKQLSKDCNPDAAVANHFRVNNSTLDTDHFFAYCVQLPKKQKRGASLPLPIYCPLLHVVFTLVLTKAAKKAKITLPPAHGFCIGGTTKYLLRGLPFEVVKHLG
jgi:hypothetical protein